MGTVLLIIKIIGLILPVILCAAALILVLAAFTPIRYYLKSDNEDNIYVSFNVFIWFKMFGFSYFYKDGFVESKLILFRRRVDYEKVFKTNEKKETKSDKDINNHKSGKAKKNKSDLRLGSKKENRKKVKDIKPKKIPFKRKKTGNTINAIKEKFNQFKAVENKKEILNYSLAFIRNLIKALKNKIFKVNIKFGFDEPDITGMALGAGCILNSMIPAEIKFEPYFEGECFEYKAEIKGRTSVFSVIVPVIKFILKKPVWNLIFNGKEEN